MRGDVQILPVLPVLEVICSAIPVPTAFPLVPLFSYQDGVLPPRPLPCQARNRSLEYFLSYSVFPPISMVSPSCSSPTALTFLLSSFPPFVVGEQGPSSHPTSPVRGDRVSFCSVKMHMDGSPLGLSVLRVTVLVEWG